MTAALSLQQRVMLNKLADFGPLPLRYLHKGTVRALEARRLVRLRQPARGAVLREVLVELR